MYKYDVALSYESESEDFVREVSDILTAEGWNVFLHWIEEKNCCLKI